MLVWRLSTWCQLSRNMFLLSPPNFKCLCNPTESIFDRRVRLQAQSGCYRWRPAPAVQHETGFLLIRRRIQKQRKKQQQMKYDERFLHWECEICFELKETKSIWATSKKGNKKGGHRVTHTTRRRVNNLPVRTGRTTEMEFRDTARVCWHSNCWNHFRLGTGEMCPENCDCFIRS